MQIPYINISNCTTQRLHAYIFTYTIHSVGSVNKSVNKTVNILGRGGEGVCKNFQQTNKH